MGINKKKILTASVTKQLDWSKSWEWDFIFT